MGKLKGKEPDYSDKNNWLRLPDITKPVDTFYLYPTAYIDTSEKSSDICELEDNRVRAEANFLYSISGTTYEESTNVFAPFYRQTNLKTVVGKTAEYFEDFNVQEQRTDVYAALDYYFTHLNQGRPFVLAGHSQGSLMCKIILKDYMQAHPEYYDRMIAAYILGFSVTKQDLSQCKHLKFSENETDTGVIVSWNTEGKGNLDSQSIVVEKDAVSINPLNWKRDETYAPEQMDLGCRICNPETLEFTHIVPGFADAQIDLKRGVVITTQKELSPIQIPIKGFEGMFGPESYHHGDYAFYYDNIKNNVKKRIDAYFSIRNAKINER